MALLISFLYFFLVVSLSLSPSSFLLLAIGVSNGAQGSPATRDSVLARFAAMKKATPPSAPLTSTGGARAADSLASRIQSQLAKKEGDY